MKRDYLKELGLTDEQIDKVMNENGKDIEKHKKEVEKAKESAEEIKAQFESFKADTKVKEAEWQKQMNAKDYEHTAKELIGGYKFTSDFAKGAFLKEFLAKGLELKEGKLVGAEDYIKDFRDNNPGVFVDENTNPSEPTAPTPTYIYSPQQGTNTPDISAQIAQAIAGTI